jgi:hypothetical protein
MTTRILRQADAANRLRQEESASGWAEIADGLRGMSDAEVSRFYTRPRRALIRDAQNEAARCAAMAQEATE